MRLPERYKQNIYISNETFFGSQSYKEPYLLRGIVSPKGDTTLLGGGVAIQQGNVEIKFESNLKGVEHITQNSLIWIKKKPDHTEKKGDFTHVVVSREATTHGWFVVIDCKSAKENFPIV